MVDLDQLSRRKGAGGGGLICDVSKGGLLQQGLLSCKPLTIDAARIKYYSRVFMLSSGVHCVMSCLCCKIRIKTVYIENRWCQKNSYSSHTCIE